MQKIHFDREKKTLVDEVDTVFSGTRVSDVVNTTHFELLYRTLAHEKALEKVLDKATEYGADTYELLSLGSRSDLNGSLLYYEATASVIFYQSIKTTKRE